MSELLKLAWRNIWRNKRRTIITAASIFFAVFMSIYMRGFQLGTYSHMIHQSVESYLGYLQVQDPNYFDEPSADYSFVYDQKLIDKLNSTEGVKVAVPRINSFSFASYGEQSKGVVMAAIDPALEKKASNPLHHLVHYRFTDKVVESILAKVNLSDSQKDELKASAGFSFKTTSQIASTLSLDEEKDAELINQIARISQFKGSYLSQIDDGVLVSDRLSKFLKIGIGDTLVLMGAGYHGASAAGLFPVRGIVKVPSPDLDNKLVYMTISRAQEYLSMPGMVSVVSINLDDPDDMLQVKEKLASQLDASQYVVKDWKELNPNLQQQIEGDSVSGLIFIGILYVIVFFGIFGTVLMMVAERKREFGVLIAIGMRKTKLAMVVVYELFYIAIIGTVVGMIAAIPVIILGYYYPYKYTGDLARMMEDMGFDPVMPMEWFGPYYYLQAVVILIMVLLVSYFPMHKIRKTKVMNSLKA